LDTDFSPPTIIIFFISLAWIKALVSSFSLSGLVRRITPLLKLATVPEARASG